MKLRTLLAAFAAATASTAAFADLEKTAIPVQASQATTRTKRMKRALAILVAAASVHSAIAGWHPGLREIAFNSGSAIDTASYDAAETNITLTLSRALSTGTRTTYTTYVYWGQIYLDGSKYNFAESFNQAVWLKIDNEIVLNNSTYNATSRGSITRAPGWYDFELRLYCNYSNAGPVSQDWWGTTARGFGWNTSGYTGKDSEHYPCPADPGDGTVFRCIDDAGTGDVLDIASTPAVSAPGAAQVRQGLAAGAGLTLSVPAVWVNETATMAATCTGWTLYNAAGGVEDSGTGNAVNYVHPSPAAYRKLVWHWTLSDPTADANRRYVKCVGGNDANNGLSWDTAFATIPAAIAACPAGGSVVVGPGTYHATNTTVTADSVVHALYIDKAITVLAAEGPEKTIVDAGADRERAAAKVAADDAILAGFTFKNSSNYSSKDKPCGVEATAGTVSNCVVSVRGQFARQGAAFRLSGTAVGRNLCVAPATWNSYNASAVVCVTGTATLDGLIITNFIYNATVNWDTGGQGGDIGYLLYLASSAVAKNVLIAGCRMGDRELLTLKSPVCLNGDRVKLTDSTIAGNRILAPYGAVYIADAKSIATNLVIWGNSTLSADHPDINDGSNAARVFHSCYSEAPANSASGSIAVDPLFVDAAHGDYHLKPLSQAAEMGATWLRPAAVAPAPFECAADADAYASAAGESLTATFTGYATEGHDVVSALWNFGDGTTGTGWPTASHTYSTPGSYTATVTVTDSNGATATFTVARNLVAVPLTCYVREGSAGTYPYDSWEKATSDLCAAVDVGSRNILVTNGTYQITGFHIPIFKTVSITSVEGPSATTLISTGGSSRDHRHFTVNGSTAALIAGFTLEDGYSASYYWAAALEMKSGTISNCVVRGTRRVCRSPANYFYGTAKAVDCVFDGAGMSIGNHDFAKQSGVRIEGDALVDRCEIKGYRIDNSSTASSFDGEAPVRIASANAVLRNSLVHHCTNGVSQAEKHRGVIGLVDGRIENCTISDNKSGGYGGGVWAKAGAIVNSIVYGNTALISGADLYSSVTTPTATNTCASDFSNWTVGAGNTTANPRFVGSRRGKPQYSLSTHSPLLNSGVLLGWMDGATDILGAPRVAGPRPAMGCYESLFTGATIMVLR